MWLCIYGYFLSLSLCRVGALAFWRTGKALFFWCLSAAAEFVVAGGWMLVRWRPF
jgi:hypothetical protein